MYEIRNSSKTLGFKFQILPEDGGVFNMCKGKGEVRPRTGNEGPEGEYRYSSTLSLTSALDGVDG